jgi:hypothetical protein
MFTNKKLKKYFLVFISLFIICNYLNKIYGQEKVLLSKNEMSGYELKNQSKIHWLVGKDNQVHYGIGQQWQILDVEEVQYVYINYCIFRSIPETILGTTFSAQSNVNPYIWGSPTGSITGDGTWQVIDGKLNNSNAIYFTRGNIGIKLFFPFYQNKDLNQRIENISKKLIEKINQNLPEEIFSAEKKAQSDSGTIKIFESSINIIDNILQKFTLCNSNFSKWVINDEQYNIGLRKEWKNNAVTIGIDLCKFNTANEAKLAAEIKCKSSNISQRFFDLDGQNLLHQLQSEWNDFLKSKISANSFSFIGTKDDISIHIYCFNAGDINFDVIYSIVNEIATKKH